MAFTLLHALLTKSPKLVVQKQFFARDFSSHTQSMLRRVTTLLATIAFSYSAFAAEFPTAKIAVVDVPSVLDNSIAVKHLRTSIDKISEQFSQELSAKEIEFKQMEAALVKKRGTAKPDQFDAEVEAFYKKLSSFQHATQKKKEKLERAHADAIDVVHENTIKIVHEIAKERKFNLAVPMSHTLYSSEAMNITEEVTSRLNHSLKEVPLKY